MSDTATIEAEVAATAGSPVKKVVEPTKEVSPSETGDTNGKSDDKT